MDNALSHMLSKEDLENAIKRIAVMLMGLYKYAIIRKIIFGDT